MWGRQQHSTGSERDVADMQWKADVSHKLEQLAVTLQALSSSMMTRKEIEEADNRRVSVDTYNSDQAAVRERLTRLEGSAARILPWVALVVSVATAGHTLHLW